MNLPLSFSPCFLVDSTLGQSTRFHMFSSKSLPTLIVPEAKGDGNLINVVKGQKKFYILECGLVWRYSITNYHKWQVYIEVQIQLGLNLRCVSCFGSTVSAAAVGNFSLPCFERRNIHVWIAIFFSWTHFSITFLPLLY